MPRAGPPAADEACALNVLGVHVGHDSSAALVAGGRIVADAAEERFSRIKHDAGLPVNAIASCLAIAGLGIDDVDAVAVPTERDVPLLNDLFDLYGGPFEQAGGQDRAAATARRLSSGAVGRPPPRRPRHALRFPLPRATPIVKVAHHLAHAAAAYHTSGRAARQLVVTLDGIGDDVSAGVWRGERGHLEPLAQIGASGSLGWFYGTVTEALGWWHGDGEGTTMGLAAYGDPEAADGVLDPFHPRYERGQLADPHDFGAMHAWSEHGALQWHSPEAQAIAELLPRHGPENIAAAAQRILEEQVLQLVEPWLERDRTGVLACAGGVFLNVKLNQRLRRSALVDHLHVYPNPGDAGLAAGAALHAFHAEQPGVVGEEIRDVCLGPSWPDTEVGAMLADRGLVATRTEDVAGAVAQRLAQGRIVGWFQGRMESGPRALGARSILMSPSRAESKDVLNTKVKLREPFRPFCPSISAERAGDYLQDPCAERFMMSCFDVRPAKRDAIPAVVHVDGTVRPQTVERETNPRFSELIDAYGALTGEYALLNTSFNLKGEPIVCHPRDAIRVFYDSGLDCLVIGDLMLTKHDPT